MATFAWIAIECLIPFSLGVVIAFAVPWRLRWVAVFGLVLAGLFWIASVLSSTPEDDGGGEGPISYWIALAALMTLIALALFCAGGWLGRTGRNALLTSRRR
jgi:peptidoglycan/LPS O-acetylase OafA/YrhL